MKDMQKLTVVSILVISFFIQTIGAVAALEMDTNNPQYPVIRGEGGDIGVAKNILEKDGKPPVFMKIWDVDKASSSGGNDKNYGFFLEYTKDFGLKRANSYFSQGGPGGKTAFDDRVFTTINQLKAFGFLGLDKYSAPAPTVVNFWTV